jgi:hypothetical protein
VLLHAVFAALIAIAITPGAVGPAACKDAVQRFEAAKREVDLAVEDYAKCVAGSRGRDSCLVEFDAVDAAQERFEAAIEEYKTVCRRVGLAGSAFEVSSEALNPSIVLFLVDHIEPVPVARVRQNGITRGKLALADMAKEV